MAKRRSVWKRLTVKDRVGIAVAVLLAVGIAVGLSLPGSSSPATEVSIPPTHKHTTSLRPLRLPAHPKVVIIGDSWTKGVAAATTQQGYAYLTAAALGWNATVTLDGSGTGYLDPGNAAVQGTYAQRLAKMPVDPAVQLLLIQGGLNDIHYPATINSTQYDDVIAGTFAQARKTFPNAKIIALGPLSVMAPGVSAAQTIASRIEYVAQQDGVYFIDPTAEIWIADDATRAKYVNVKAQHPNTAGHAYIAQRLEADIRRLG